MPIANKPGEPEFKLKVEPSEKLCFKFKSGEEVTIDLKITNPLKERNSFKIKCTDNEIFRVRPPLGFVKPNESATIKITLKAKTAPDPTRHFFAIYHITCNDMKVNEKAVWNGVKAEGVCRLQAQIEGLESTSGATEKAKDDESTIEKKEEKKDDKKEEKKEEKTADKKEEYKKEEEKK